MADIPLLSGVFDRLEDYQREVIKDKIQGHGMRGLTRMDPSFTPPMLKGIMPLISPNQADASEASSKGLVGKQWVDAAYRNSPWQEFGSGALLDPTNLVGFGLPGMGVKAAAKVPLVGSQLATGLKAANVLDQLPGQVTGKGIELAGKAGSGVLRGVADTLGPHVPHHPLLDKFGKGYEKTLQGWRENALLSPAFHLNNYVGNVALAAQSGQWDVTKAAAMAPFTGRSQSVSNTLSRLGNNRPKLAYPPGSTPPPIDPANFNVRWTGETGKLGREPNVNNPLSTPSVFRDIPDSIAPANYARDKFSDLSEASKKFGSNRVEGPGIDAAFYKAFKPVFKQNVNDFYREIRALERAMPGNAQIRDVESAFRLNKGQMSPDDLREILFPGTRGRRARYAGMPPPPGGRKPSSRVPDWRDDLIKKWEDRVIDSMQAGTKNSTDVFFDYTANNPIDVLGQNTLGFHRFAINNLPKSLAAAGRRPVYANVPSEYYRVSDEYNEQEGLPRSYHGKMPIGGRLPGGGQLSMDPMGILPMGMLVKSATRPSSTMDDKGSVIGDVADDLRGLGLGLNPFIDALLTVTGQHGRSFAPSFLRASQPVNGIMSSVLDRPVDIEGGSKDLFGYGQEALTGQAPFPYQEYLLRKRQAELKAFSKDPGAAGSQVGDTMALEGVTGFMGIPGLKLLTPEEQQIRRNSALARAYKLAGNEQAYRDNPTSRAYADLDPRDALVRDWDKQSADVRQRLFRDPEVLEALVDQYNWRKLSASERQKLLLNPEYRDRLLDSMAGQLHNNGGSGTQGGSGKQHPNPFMRPTRK